MSVLLRLILFVCLVFAGQSYATTAISYGYVANTVQSGAENLNNNGLINPSGCCSKLSSRDSQDRDQGRAFFAFAADFDVPKGVTSTDFDSVTNFFKSNGKLPDNYLTKAEAKALGWDPKKGNLADVAPGKSIGGDVFKNNEGLLPNAPNRTWYEADINYTGGYRNSDRFVYSSDGLLYKSTDHYKTFTKVE